MQIKTYTAENMQEAFYKVKREMGNDAVILQTKRVKKGGFLGLFAKTMVEVVAANDVKLSTNINKPKLSKNLLKRSKLKESSKNVESKSLDNLKADISEVKDLIRALHKKQDKSINSQKNNFPQPLQKYYAIMKDMYVEPSIIENILENTSEILSEDDLDNEKKVNDVIKNQIKSKIGKAKPIKLQDNNNTIVAFVGPTGVGKTTTIAKIAANYTLYHDKKVAMVTADTFRVGAVEQLKLYGNLLEIPVVVVYSPDEIRDILQNLKEYDLVLVDTMGSSPNNKMQIKKIKGFLEKLNPTDVHMVMSAVTKTEDIDDILENYQELDYKKLIVTKLDETTTYGFIMNALNMTGCNLSYITAGQNVPEDIEIADIEKITDLILGGLE